MAKLFVLYFCPTTADAEMVEGVLLGEGLDARVFAVSQIDPFLQGLARPDLDLVLIRHEAAFRWDAFLEAREHARVPIVILADECRRDEALPYLRTGAEDVVSRAELWRLGPLAQRLVFHALADPEETPEEPRRAPDNTLVDSLGGALRRLSAANSVEKVAEVVVEALRRLLRADGAAFFRRKGRYAECLAEDADELIWRDRKSPANQSVAAWCFKHKLPLVVGDAWIDKRIPPNGLAARVRGLIMVPVALTATASGVAVVYWRQPRRGTDEVLSLAEILANFAGTMIQDMLAQGDLGRLVQERTRILHAVNEELETFAYTVSHDLKTPLSVIKTSTWMLKESCGAELDERGRKCIDRLEAAADRMHGRIEGMLAMYRLTRGSLEPEEVDLTAVANEAADAFREQQRARVVEWRVAPGLVAYGDPALLRVVVENLLANAWKFTSKVPTAVIEFGKEQRGGQCVFYVRDNGAGFDKSCAGKLFGTFQRLHGESEFTGTGVGLASVKRIINRHGGRVWAEGEVNQGATFFFSLPEKPGEDAAS